MTVQKDVTKNIYVGNGSTRTFPFTFECPAEHPEYIKVYLMQDDGTALATSDYQLDMDARQITYPSSGTALPEGKKLVIMRELPLQQMMNLVNNGPYFAEDVETAFDENVMAMQQIAEKLNRSIIMNVDIDSDAFVNEVPFEAGKSFRIADDGKSIVLTEDPARVLPLAQEAYAQAQAQAQIASASAAAAAKSENSAFESAGVAGNSAQYASLSAASAAENAELTSGYKQEALTAKADATASATNAKASEANAKISENNAEASKEAAQSAATAASNFASAARNSAGEAKTYRNDAKTYMDDAKTYMDNAKNYSENVNVFVPSVSSAGVLSWTNKAGLTNPKSVNIKGAKGDTGTAATITIGSVTTGAPGTNASVTNSGTSSAAILNFQIPRGAPGADGGVTVDDVLNSTSFNPIANRTVYAALQDKLNKTDTIYEANLGWGGRNLADDYSPVDASMIPELGANRFMFGKPKGVTVEYSEDAGATWNDYGAGEDTIRSLFSNAARYVYAGGEKTRLPSVNDMLRITIDVDTFGVYSRLNKFALYISSGGAYGCYCTIDASLEKSPTVFKVFADKAPISGWSGYNIINTRTFETYSNQASKQYGLIRFTFGCTDVPTNSTSKGLALLSIKAFGGICWNTPSNMAKQGHLYAYNAWQEATFPANVSAPAFIGNLTGTADKAKSDGEGNVITETYAKKDTANKWNALQSFKQVLLGAERYLSTVVSGTSHTPQMSVMHYIATGTFTLNLQKIEASLEPSNSSVFTAYIESSADYPLHIETAGALKYIGSASDIAITSAGLLLNILMLKDSSGNVTSIVQASMMMRNEVKVEDGSKNWSYAETNNETIAFTVPQGIKRIKVVAVVDSVEGNLQDSNYASIENKMTNKIWGEGFSESDESGELQGHQDIDSIVGVTPNKTYTLYFGCWATGGVTFSWGKAINDMAPTVEDY